MKAQVFFRFALLMDGGCFPLLSSLGVGGIKDGGS